MNAQYAHSIHRIKQAGIRYVARLVIFPNGGTHAQVSSEHYWKKRYQLIQRALALGVNEIQLDYIRYNTSRRPSRQNIKNIYKVIRWYKNQLHHTGITLQICVFGETSFGPSLRIGQDVYQFSDTIDVLNPMLYPSHYEPYRKYSRQPYWTISHSLYALKQQFRGKNIPFRIIPNIS